MRTEISENFSWTDCALGSRFNLVVNVNSRAQSAQSLPHFTVPVSCPAFLGSALSPLGTTSQTTRFSQLSGRRFTQKYTFFRVQCHVV